METEDQGQDQEQQTPPEDDIAALKSRLAAAEERNSTLEQKLGHVATNLEAITRANYARAVKAVRAEMRQAAETGDTARFDAAEKAEQELMQQAPQTGQTGDNQNFVAWQQRNSWYGKDEEASRFANTIAKGLIDEGFVPGSMAHYNEIARQTRKHFPQKFRPTASATAPAVEGAGQTGRTQGGKTAADMPAGWEAAADSFIRQNVYKNRDEYVKAFWKHSAGEQNAA